MSESSMTQHHQTGAHRYAGNWFAVDCFCGQNLAARPSMAEAMEVFADHQQEHGWDNASKCTRILASRLA